MALLKKINRKLESIFLDIGLYHNTTWEDLSGKDHLFIYAGEVTRPDIYPGYFGITPYCKKRNHLRHDITKPFLLEDSSVDRFQAEDVFEHIQYNEILKVFNEIHRVLKPGGIFRFSVPDYRFPYYDERVLKDDHGNIIFDPGGGGRYVNGSVVDGGHVWFPMYESVYKLFHDSPFEDSKTQYLQYNDPSGEVVCNKVDYDLGYIYRTPDHDPRAMKLNKPMSVIVDAYK